MKKRIGNKKDLKELVKLTLLNILSVQGVIYTHYKNKQLKQRGKQCDHAEKHIINNGI